MAMIKIFKVLLIVGILITLSSVYFVFFDDVYAIYASTVGLLLVAFSVFEIVSLKRSDYGEWVAEKPVASSKKIAPVKRGKKEEGLEWTFYDLNADLRKTGGKRIGKVEVSKKNVGEIINGERRARIGFFERLFGKKKIKEDVKKLGEKIDNGEIKVKKLKTREERESEKFRILENYVKKAIDAEVPREKIFEAALDSDWPAEIVLKTIEKIVKKGNRKKIVVLLSLSLIALICLLLLVVGDNLLVGQWIDALSEGSMIAYIFTLLAFATMIVFFFVRIKVLMKRKKNIYKVVRDRKIKELRKSVKKEEKKTGEITFGFGYKTDIDKLLDLVIEKKKIVFSEAAETFGVQKKEIESWGKILKDRNLINIYYPTVGEAELRWKKRKQEEEE